MYSCTCNQVEHGCFRKKFNAYVNLALLAPVGTKINTQLWLIACKLKSKSKTDALIGHSPIYLSFTCICLLIFSQVCVPLFLVTVDN